jgi:hypothetical protein
MKLLLSLTLVLLAGAVQANEWVDYQHLGDCVQTLDESNYGKFDFYAADLNLKKKTAGFTALTVTEAKVTSIFGGYDAKYTLNKKSTEMTVYIGGVLDLTLVIPFGENVTVMADNKKFVCNTKLPQ